MKRSGVNGKVKVRERIVQPRLIDAVHDILKMMSQFGQDGLELFGSDFADAFKQIWVDPAEWKHLSGQALDGFLHYMTNIRG